jgi:putative membrane protein
MTKTIAVMFSLGLAIGGSALAQTTGSTADKTTTTKSSTTTKTSSMNKTSGMEKLSSADRTFMRNAAAGGAAEVKKGQLASEKASNQKVKDFGQRMVTDHSKANDELKALADRKGVTIPTKPDSKNEAMATKLGKMSGSEFDRNYMKDMVSDHEKDVAEFEKEANNGTDPDVKKWAADTLPTLQEHLKMAKDTLATVSP